MVLAAAGPGGCVPIGLAVNRHRHSSDHPHGPATVIRSVAIMPSMPQSSVLSQASSDPDEVVVGVDTYKDVHVAAVLTALGVLRETKTFPATTAGYNRCWRG
jgi:hypothetical protein